MHCDRYKLTLGTNRAAVQTFPAAQADRLLKALMVSAHQIQPRTSGRWIPVIFYAEQEVRPRGA